MFQKPNENEEVNLPDEIMSGFVDFIHSLVGLSDDEIRKELVRLRNLEKSGRPTEARGRVNPSEIRGLRARISFFDDLATMRGIKRNPNHESEETKKP